MVASQRERERRLPAVCDEPRDYTHRSIGKDSEPACHFIGSDSDEFCGCVESRDARGPDDDPLDSRLHALTDAMGRLEALVNEQAEKIASIRELATTETSPQYVQRDVTATVHRLRPGGTFRSICGIATAGATFRARRLDKKTYVPIHSLKDIPGILLCDRCLNIERARSLEKELIDAASSRDEVDE